MIKILMFFCLLLALSGCVGSEKNHQNKEIGIKAFDELKKKGDSANENWHNERKKAIGSLDLFHQGILDGWFQIEIDYAEVGKKSLTTSVESEGTGFKIINFSDDGLVEDIQYFINDQEVDNNEYIKYHFDRIHRYKKALAKYEVFIEEVEKDLFKGIFLLYKVGNKCTGNEVKDRGDFTLTAKCSEGKIISVEYRIGKRVSNQESYLKYQFSKLNNEYVFQYLID